MKAQQAIDEGVPIFRDEKRDKLEYRKFCVMQASNQAKNTIQSLYDMILDKCPKISKSTPKKISGFLDRFVELIKKVSEIY